jgi:hypothetical protein
VPPRARRQIVKAFEEQITVTSSVNVSITGVTGIPSLSMVNAGGRVGYEPPADFRSRPLAGISLLPITVRRELWNAKVHPKRKNPQKRRWRWEQERFSKAA